MHKVCDMSPSDYTDLMGRGIGEATQASTAMRNTSSSDGGMPPSKHELTDVDVVVRELLYYFPGLVASPDRTSILVYALSSGGNGFEWQDGKLANIFDYGSYRQETPLIRDTQEEFERQLVEERERRARAGDADEEISDFSKEMLLKDATRKAGNVAYVHDNLDDLMARRAQPEKIATISKSAPLANIPDDASDTWLDACEETARVVLAGTRTTYVLDSDLDPKPVTPLEERERMGEIFSEMMGDEPQAQLSDEELQSEVDIERQMRFDADARAIKSNHDIAAAALQRIAELRAQRAA